MKDEFAIEEIKKLSELLLSVPENGKMETVYDGATAMCAVNGYYRNYPQDLETFVARARNVGVLLNGVNCFDHPCLGPLGVDQELLVVIYKAKMYHIDKISRGKGLKPARPPFRENPEWDVYLREQEEKRRKQSIDENIQTYLQIVRP